MAQHEVTRTLVKSQPEVWTQCSDADSLGRHLNGSFGEIRITRLEPEHSVAWEGAEVSGTVRIEPSAWGTRVTLAVQMDEAPVVPALTAAGGGEAPEAPAPVVLEPEPVSILAPPPRVEEPPPPEPARPVGLFARLWERLRPVPEPAVTDEVAEEPEPELPDDPEVADEPIAELELEPEAEVMAEQEPPQPEPSPASEPAEPPSDTVAALNAALESMGQAHHRPYSRA